LNFDKIVYEIVEKVKNTPSGKVAMAGCSFRAYHAANFAFGIRLSHLFFICWCIRYQSFLNGFHNDDVFYNSPLDFFVRLEDHELWNIDIVLGTSNWIYVMMPI
jgi:esterase/lipase superfamily enzyme